VFVSPHVFGFGAQSQACVSSLARDPMIFPLLIVLAQDAGLPQSFPWDAFLKQHYVRRVDA